MQRKKMRKAVAALPSGMQPTGRTIKMFDGTERRLHGLEDAMTLVHNGRTRQRIRARYQRQEAAR